MTAFRRDADGMAPVGVARDEGWFIATDPANGAPALPPSPRRAPAVCYKGRGNARADGAPTRIGNGEERSAAAWPITV